jgi:AraC-like DNA-binding protein
MAKTIPSMTQKVRRNDLQLVSEKFCFMSMPDTSQDILQNWGRVSCRLVQAYQGEPTNFQGEFQSSNMIVWLIVKGSVRQNYQGREFHASEKEWMVSNACRRRQDFSSDAKIVSIHLHIDSGRAEWHGPRIVAFGNETPLFASAQRLVRVYETPTTNMEAYAEMQATMWDFFGRLIPQLNRQGMEMLQPRISDERVKRTMEFLERLALNESWNRERLASVAGVSASQIDRLWREACGHTPYHYWDRLRIGFAQEKLENTNWTIKAIASELGFTQLAQFSNWFRAHQRMSPRSYRERLDKR